MRFQGFSTVMLVVGYQKQTLHAIGDLCQRLNLGSEALVQAVNPLGVVRKEARDH